MAAITVENRRRGIDNNLGIFTQALMWFMDGAVTQEKLGILKLMLCNLNSDCDCEDHIKEKINPMIDTIMDLIGEIQENKKVVDFHSRQSFWLQLRRKEVKRMEKVEKEKEKVEKEKVEKDQTCQKTVQSLNKSYVNAVASLLNFVTLIPEHMRTFVGNVKRF